jgi:hypothetical protein
MKIRNKQFPVVGSGVLTAVVTKISIFWDTTACSPLTVNRLHAVKSQERTLRFPVKFRRDFLLVI